MRMADWVTKIDEDDDLGRICGEYVCDWCEETGDWGEIEHDDTCPIGEIQRLERDSNDFLQSLAARDQEVFKLCDAGRRLHEAIMSPDSPLKFVHAELAEPLDDLMAAIRVAEPSG